MFSDKFMVATHFTSFNSIVYLQTDYGILLDAIVTVIYHFPSNVSIATILDCYLFGKFAVFEECDLRRKGYLDYEDIKVAIINLFGYKPSKYEIEQLMRTTKNQSPGLGREKFQSLMEAKLSLEDEEQEHRQIFNILDIDCKGFLTLQDLKIGFSSIAPCLPATSILSCFELLDQDADGRISYRDFERCMKSTVS